MNQQQEQESKKEFIVGLDEVIDVLSEEGKNCPLMITQRCIDMLSKIKDQMKRIKCPFYNEGRCSCKGQRMKNVMEFKDDDEKREFHLNIAIRKLLKLIESGGEESHAMQMFDAIEEVKKYLL